MSDQQPVPPLALRPSLNIFLSILMVLIGIVLLLPGLCSLIFAAITLSNLRSLDNALGVVEILPLWIFGLVIGAAGVGLIVLAIRR